MKVSNELIGTTIARLRKKKNLTQQQFAAVLGVSHQAVSKWETGAALPDLDSLCGIAQLFGITMDQLISGNVPGYDEEDSPLDGVINFAQDAFNTVKGIGESIINIVSDALTPDEEPGEPTGEVLSLNAILELAPFMSREKLGEALLNNREVATLEQLTQLAPFVSGEVLEQLLKRNEGNYTIDQLTALAPFMKKEQLFRLLLTHGGQITLTTVKTFAPFLKKSMVDALVEIAAGVKKVSAELKDRLEAPAEVKLEEAQVPAAPSELKLKVAKAALEAGSWAWLRAHIQELKDAELLKDIALAAAGNAEAADLLPAAAALLEGTRLKALFEVLFEGRNYAALNKIGSLATEEIANALLTDMAAECTDEAEFIETAKQLAGKADKQVLDEVIKKALESGNWQLIEALTPAM